MKQRITVEQLQELNEKQREELHKFWFDDDDNWVQRKGLQNCVDVDDIALPLLNIGEMIQLVVERAKTMTIPLELVNGEVITWKDGNVKLADALWMATKDVLSK